jgi:hypothetical protein
MCCDTDMTVIDAVVLDYGFQPIVNYFAKHPFDLAINAAIGGFVMMSVAVSLLVSWHNISFVMLALMAIFSQGFALGAVRIALLRMRPLIVPGVRNPLRYVLLRVRLGFVMIVMVMMLWTSLVMITMHTIYSMLTSLALIGGVLWCISFYFESCDCPPLKPKRVRPPIGRELKLADL